MHSDESWLSGYTRTVWEKGTLQTTESFFDLYPRAVHALRTMFVGLQSVVMVLFGYQLFSFRLLSLVFSTLTLYMLWLYLSDHAPVIRWSMVALWAVNLQFLYASHMARQESILLFVLIASLWCLKQGHLKSMAVLIVWSMGIHPNSFLLGLSMGTLLLYEAFAGRHSGKGVLIYAAMLTMGFVLFIGSSVALNPHFVSEYLAYGESQGIGPVGQGRLQGLWQYYVKLFTQTSGTYLLMEQKAQLILLAISLLIGAGKWIRHKASRDLIWAMLLFLSLNVAFVVMGRFNQTAFVFFLFSGYLVFIEVIPSPLKYKTACLSLCIILAMTQSILFIREQPEEKYQQFLDQLSLPGNSRVLANLNSEYLFKDRLLDVRNLDHLKQNDLSIAQYMAKHQVEYVILYEEMDYIYQTRPSWDILYGDLSYYPELKAYLTSHGTLVRTFNSTTYAMRIARYVGDYPWSVRIYKLRPLQ